MVNMNTASRSNIKGNGLVLYGAGYDITRYIRYAKWCI